MHSSAIFRANFVEYSYLHIHDILLKVAEPNSKIAVFCHKELVQFINRQRNSSSLPNVLKENLFSDTAGLVFGAKSRFYFPFNKAISQLFEGGLTDFWRNNYYEMNKRNLYRPESGPEVFSMDHLAVGFYIWLACLAIGSISFLIEAVTARCQRRLLLWLY